MRIDTGSGFDYVAPVGGPYSTPAPGHAYTYVLLGQGISSSFAFEYRDSPTYDNYGAFQINVRAATKDDCMNGHWTQFGVFKNQGDCVSYIATHGRNPGSGYE